LVRLVFFLAFDFGFRVAAFLPAFFLADGFGFEALAFLTALLALSITSEDAVAKRWAVFSILPTVEPTPRAIVVIRSGELTAFLTMISPVERCAASASQVTASITTASQHDQCFVLSLRI
jgi:hypothetical protein